MKIVGKQSLAVRVPRALVRRIRFPVFRLGRLETLGNSSRA
jgi:hypothetical protein